MFQVQFVQFACLDSIKVQNHWSIFLTPLKKSIRAMCKRGNFRLPDGGGKSFSLTRDFFGPSGPPRVKGRFGVRLEASLGTAAEDRIRSTTGAHATFHVLPHKHKIKQIRAQSCRGGDVTMSKKNSGLKPVTMANVG